MNRDYEKSEYLIIFANSIKGKCKTVLSESAYYTNTFQNSNINQQILCKQRETELS